MVVGACSDLAPARGLHRRGHVVRRKGEGLEGLERVRHREQVVAFALAGLKVQHSVSAASAQRSSPQWQFREQASFSSPFFV